MDQRLVLKLIPAITAVAAVAVLVHWLAARPAGRDLQPRLPGQDNVKALEAPAVDLRGAFATGPGRPADLPGSWPRFRGERFDAVGRDSVPLARRWRAGAPARLWSVELGEGYGGPAVLGGRVYVLDYDQQRKADALRCLSLADGREIWRHSYEIEISRNHGITRTVPAVTERWVVSLGPKCHVICLDSTTGSFKWGIDLVRQYRTTVPPWYAGQCPLIDDGKAIIAPAGEALMIAVDCETGNVVWTTPNPRGWEMTHSSVVPMMFQGKRTYVYCGSGGVVGVSAEDGSIVWDTTAWKVSMANVPTPIVVGDDRLFLCGGYGAGAMMLRLEESAGKIVANELFRLKPEVFGAEQQTPVLYQNHIYGVIPNGQLVCIDLEGTVRWTSGPKNRYGLGPYIVADGMLILMNDHGVLSLVEATEKAFQPLASAKVFEDGHEAWGPLALVAGRLLARDMNHLICVDLRKASHE